MKGKGMIGALVVGMSLVVGGYSECWVYSGYACEDGHAIAVFCNDVTGWWDVVYL